MNDNTTIQFINILLQYILLLCLNMSSWLETLSHIAAIFKITLNGPAFR